MRSERSRMGYLFVDHRASPGMGEQDAADVGYAPETVREGSVLELHTAQCKHCGGCYILRPDRDRERGRCYGCNWYLCDACAAVYKITGRCTPYVARADFHIGGEQRSALWIPRGIEDQSNRTLMLTGAGQ